MNHRSINEMKEKIRFEKILSLSYAAIYFKGVYAECLNPFIENNKIS